MRIGVTRVDHLDSGNAIVKLVTQRGEFQESESEENQAEELLWGQEGNAGRGDPANSLDQCFKGGCCNIPSLSITLNRPQTHVISLLIKHKSPLSSYTHNNVFTPSINPPTPYPHPHGGIGASLG